MRSDSLFDKTAIFLLPTGLSAKDRMRDHLEISHVYTSYFPNTSNMTDLEQDDGVKLLNCVVCIFIFRTSWFSRFVI